MISLYYAIGIFFFLFSLLFYLRRKKGVIFLSLWQTIILYIVTRGMSLFIIRRVSLYVLITLIADILLLIGLNMLSNSKNWKHPLGTIGILYLTNPVILLFAISGQPTQMIILILVLAIIWIALYACKLRFGTLSLIQFYPEYTGFSVSLFLCYIASQTLLQTFADCFTSKPPYPILLIFSLYLFAFTAIMACLHLFFRREQTIMFPSVPLTECPAEAIKYADYFKWKDIPFILGLSFIIGLCIFYRLGSTTAPEKEFHFATDAPDGKVVLNFEEPTEISNLVIYLGYHNHDNYSICYLDESFQQVMLPCETNQLKSVFNWNKFPVNQITRQITIQTDAPEAVFHEIVVLDAKQNPILPQYADTYATLFDEQEKYPANLTYYYNTMFDEVYHGRTAYEFVHHTPSIYETTHPHLGKLLIALGVKMFGMTPFGWRFASAIFGILMVPLMYFFLLKMTGNRLLTVFGTLLLGSEFMHLLLSRIATLDSIAGVCILAMFFFMYCFIRDLQDDKSLKTQCLHLLLCGFSTSCAIAVKFTGFYAALGLIVILVYFLIPYFKHSGHYAAKKKQLWTLFSVCVVSFLLLPPIVYTLSFYPLWLNAQDKSLLQVTLDNTKWMFEYHSDIYFRHTYSSNWYEWLIVRQPLLDSICYIEDKISTVSTFPNPWIAITGLVALAHNFYLWFCKKNNTSAFLCIAYLSQIVPWMSGIRTVFIYHYYPCMLILILLITNSFAQLKKHRYTCMIIFTCVSIAFFVLFFPVLTGLPVSTEFVNQVLEFLPTWIFA